MKGWVRKNEEWEIRKVVQKIWGQCSWDDFNVYLKSFALAGVAQWTKCQPVNQKVASWIPSQDTCLGCGPGPQWGVYERQTHTDVSLPLFLLPFPSL